jgi:hypothetical protein
MSKTIKKIKAEGNSQSKKTKKSNKPILLPDQDTRVAEIAYQKAKNRNFLPRYELDDWLEAEKEFSF